MCARAEDLQEEKNQQNIEVILEKKQRDVLTQSYSLINLVLVLLGVYVAVLSVIFFPTIFSPSSTNTSIQQVSTVDPIETFVYSIETSGALILSILLILVSIINLWRSIGLGNACLKGKFIKKEYPFASIQLKSGYYLRKRNVKLFKYVIEQNKSNDDSIYFIILSLIFFILFFLAKIGTEASFKAFYCLFILLIAAIVGLKVYYGKNFGK